MLLYTGEYGLSELRVYTLAFMGWLALVLAWFTLTVLRGQRRRFAFGAAAAGVVVVAALNVTNIDGAIARVNLTRAAADQARLAGVVVRGGERRSGDHAVAGLEHPGQ